MRELTLSEIELVAGGGQSSGEGAAVVDDIDVVADDGDSWGDWLDHGDFGDYGDGAGDGRGVDSDPVPRCGPDAQARAAAAMFFAAAAAEGQHVSYRERAAYIIQNSDGTYRLSGYTEVRP